MKRVAVFRTALLPISETFIAEQALALQTWRPVLVGRREVAGGLQTPGLPREIVPVAPSRAVRALRSGLWMPEPRMRQRLQELRVDLVHAHFGTDASEVWPSVKAAGLPMVVTLHGYDIHIDRPWWQGGHGGLQNRLYPRRLLKLAREPKVNFIAVSQALKRHAVGRGIPAGKISVAYIGVDTERFQPGGLPLAERRRRVLFIGRMVEKKAPLLMVRIFAELRKEVPHAELVMIGDGPLLGAAKGLAGDLRVPVAFLGARRSDEVLAQMHEARVFCLPSVTAENGDAEGFGLVLLEAQACGVPVVTSARGGAQEGLLDGRTGAACREGAVPEFVAAMRALLCNDALAAQASVEATRFVRSTFSIRKCSGELERLYAQATTGTDRP